MRLRTELKIKESPRPISYQKPLVFIGSCFAQSIGTKVATDKFDALINPFGTIYNPMSIAKLISRTIDTQTPDSHHIIGQGVSRFLHFDYHSDIVGRDPGLLQQAISQAHERLSTQLSTASHLFITLGTALVYRHIEQDHIVANCHKLPAKTFDRQLLATEHIIKTWEQLIEKLSGLYPELQITLTVSPVRHIRDGLIENNRSKARLIDSCHTLCELFDHVDYFPAYEILLDELRDYRFFDRDLVHPNELAVDYIYERYETCYYREETMTVVNEVRKLLKSVAHRAFDPESSAHQQFLQKLLTKCNALTSKHPINLEKEINYISEQLI